MNIAFIGQKGIPATFGGVECHVDELTRRLVQRDHNVDVYVRDWYTRKDLENHNGVKLIHTPTIQGKHLDAFVHSFTSSLHSIFQDYDIIHYHALGPSFFSWIPKLFRKKIVGTIHRLDWQAGKWGKFAQAFLGFTENCAVYIPAKTIVVSRTLQEYFLSKYRRKLTYIPNGVKIPELLPPDLITNKYGLKGNDYILFLGRLVPEKRPDWILKAFQNISKENRDIKLVIAGGESGARSYYENLKKLSMGDTKIIFTDYVTGKEKEELFSNTLLFVLPSYLEGLPIALLEAMSYERCCLVSDIDPHLEVIEDGMNGYFFRSDSLPDLTSRLESILKMKEELFQIGRSARSKVEKHYNWETVTEETEKVYFQVLEN